MSSEDDFTDEELIEEPSVDSNLVSSREISLGNYTSGTINEVCFPVAYSNEEEVVSSARYLASSAKPETKDEDDFTDEELIEEPSVDSNVVSSTEISLGNYTTGTINEVPFSVANSNEEDVVSSAGYLASSATREIKVEIPTAIPSTSRTSVPITSTGNDAYMRFLAERKDDNFSSDEFSSDEQRSDSSLDEFEDVNDNSKVKRDLQALQAYLSQEDSSCDETYSVKSVSVIGAIPHLNSPFVQLGDDTVSCKVNLINESLKHNKACVERLDKATEAVEKKLAEIRARFLIVTKEISAAIKVKRSEGWMLNLCHTSPYFRDMRGFPPPFNADYIGKLKRKEISEDKFLRERTLLVRDSKFICDEVKKWEIEGILLKREVDRNAIRRKIAQCTDAEEKAALSKQLSDEKEFRTDHLTLEQVVGSRKEGHPDWLAMSVHKLGVERSPEAIQAIWENFLDPRLPKGGWTDEEDFRLREIATEHKEEDWSAIAKELGTGRTGFMCFMRFKGAVDREFIGTRFNTQEDGFVRRSVAATTFNHQVSWNQTEFLYRGRRDRRSLKMRWYRLEAEANEELRKGKFTEDEDLAILRAAHEVGKTDFAAIARIAFGNARTGSQVQMRYQRLTTESKRGQWTLDEDILLVRLVSQMGRNWRKVREAFGEHRTKEQLRFRHESVARHVSEHLTATHQTLDEVLAEMASSVRVTTRLHGQRTNNFYVMDEDKVRERQKSLERRRRTYYVRKRASAKIDDLYLQHFAVCYNPPDFHQSPQEPPAPSELADMLSMLLLLLGADIPLPEEDPLDPINNDPVLGPALSYLRSNNADASQRASNMANKRLNSSSSLNHSNAGQETSNTADRGPNSSTILNHSNAGGTASNMADHVQNSSTNLKNSNVGQTHLNPPNQGLKQSSEDLRSLNTSGQSSACSVSASDNHEQNVDPLAIDPGMKLEVGDNCPKRYLPSNFLSRKKAGPMVSIPSLEVMKDSAQGVKFVAAVAPIDVAKSLSVATRKSTRGLRIVPLNKTSAAFEKAEKIRELPAHEVQSAKNKKQPVVLVVKTEGKEQVSDTVAETIENVIQMADKDAEGPNETKESIDLELPVTALESKANLVSLSSLMPLKTDVTPLQSKAAAKAFSDKIEIISNGKKIVLTKVARLPQGVKIANAKAITLPVTMLSTTATSSKRPAPSPTEVPPFKKLKATSSKQPDPSPTEVSPPQNLRATVEEQTQIDPWTGLPVIARSSFQLKGERSFGRLRGTLTNNELFGFLTPVLPPGLISMIGIRTLLGSMNSLPALTAVRQPEQDEASTGTSESRMAERLWDSRIFSLFSFPALLARNPLVQQQKPVPALVVNMERQFPPIGQTLLPGGRRSYTRKRPQKD